MENPVLSQAPGLADICCCPPAALIWSGRCLPPEPAPQPYPPVPMRLKPLLSDLGMKKLRDEVQHLQNELIRVSWGHRERGAKGRRPGKECPGAEGREAQREGGLDSGHSAEGPGVDPRGQG